MASLSDFLEDAWLRTISEGTAYSAPATWIALFLSGGAEVGGGGYQRVQVNQDGTTQPFWRAPVDGAGDEKVIDNNGEVAFPQATDDWGTVTEVGIMDASSGGNELAREALVNAQTVNTGSIFTFSDGDLNFTND